MSTTTTRTRFAGSVPASGNGTHPTPVDASDRGRPGRRVVGLVAVGVVIAALSFVYDPRNLLTDDASTDVTLLRETAQVGRASLADGYTADGTVAFADSFSSTFVAPSAGPPEPANTPVANSVVTEVIAEGAEIAAGDVLWRVGLEPTVALYGTVPAYRDLDRGAEGPDVGQLELNLVALGFDPDGVVTVDEIYTANTEAMVERWQESIGAEVTGEVSVSSVVYVAGPSRVGAVVIDVGSAIQDGSPMLGITALTRTVEFSVPAAERATLGVGDSVGVRFPDRSTVSATVVAVAIDDVGGALVTAHPDDPVESVVDVVPVTVDWDVSLGEDLLTVPAGALIRTDSGRYHVEVRDADGTERMVAVDIGHSSGGLVEVSGDIAEGDVVIAP